MKHSKLTKATTGKHTMWTMDIATIRMKSGVRYFAVIMDDSRVLGWKIAESVNPKWVRQTLEETINLQGIPEGLYTDRALTFCADEYTSYLEELGIGRMERGKGKSKGAILERLFGNLRHSHLRTHPKDEQELRERVREYILDFNARRSHVSQT